MNTYYLLKPAAVTYRLIVENRDNDVTIVKEVETEGITPDFLITPFPMISDRLKCLFEKFIEEDLYKPCVIVQKPGVLFWEFTPLKVPDQYVRFTLGGDVCAVEDFGLQPFLIIEGTKKTSCLISRIVAESLLRRGYTILDLKQVLTIPPSEGD